MVKLKSQGFTLIELLVVMALIAILATVVSLYYGGIRNRASDGKKKSEVDVIIKTYEVHFDTATSAYPVLQPNWFAGNQIPDPLIYTGQITSSSNTGIRICTTLSNSTQYCRESTQIKYIASASPSPSASTPPQSYTCTMFIGYSQTNNWFPVFSGQVGTNYEMKMQFGGAAIYWADPNDTIWNAPIGFPCASSSSSPTRVVADITHNQYLRSGTTLDPPSYNTGGGNYIVFMENVIRAEVVTIHNKLPSVTRIELQPAVGGPAGTNCTASITGFSDDVRSTVNHPFIWQAIQNVVNNPPTGLGTTTVGLSLKKTVNSCSEFDDSTGHLSTGSGSGAEDIGNKLANFYTL